MWTPCFLFLHSSPDMAIVSHEGGENTSLIMCLHFKKGMKRKKKSVALQRSQITLRSELFPTFTTQFITLKYQSNADTFQQLVIHHNQLDLSEPSLRADNPVVKPSSALIPVRVVRSMLSLSLLKRLKKALLTGVCRPDVLSCYRRPQARWCT